MESGGLPSCSVGLISCSVGLRLGEQSLIGSEIASEGKAELEACLELLAASSSAHRLDGPAAIHVMTPEFEKVLMKAMINKRGFPHANRNPDQQSRRT